MIFALDNNSLNNINALYIIVLIIILVYLLNNQNALELFMNDVKQKFNNYCNPNNDCYKGQQLRIQKYQNMCEPKFGLLRQPIALVDNCQRTLSPNLIFTQN
tara:strand:- start:40 stop:345 length:306 start_codon:yes stop_codon:yes gene_type:complete